MKNPTLNAATAAKKTVLFKVWSIFFCLSLIPSVLHADNNLDALKRDLEQALKQNTVVLSEQLILFRYETGGGASGYYPRSLSEAQQHLTSTPDYFFDPTVKDDNAVGPGLYAAVDPVASRDYGSDDPQLYVFALPKGSRIASVKADLDDALEDRLAKSLKASQCDQNSIGIVESDLSWSDIFSRLRTHSKIECRKALTDTVHNLGLDAIAYSFSGVHNLTSCRSSRETAINILRRNAIDLNVFAFYNQQNRFETKPLRKAVRQLFNEGSNDLMLAFNSNGSAPPSGLGKMVLTNDYSDWKKQNIFGCGDKINLLKSAGDDLTSAIHNIYGDNEIYKTIEQVTQVFSNRFNNVEHDLSSLRALRLKELELLRSWNKNLTLDSLNAALNLSESDEPHEAENLSSKIYSLLGELLPPDSEKKMKILLREVPQTMPQERKLGALPYKLRSLGLGKIYSILVLNRTIIAFRGVPYLVDAPTDNPYREYSQVFQQNKAAYLKILKECSAIYSNTSLSNEQILAGPCGFELENKQR